MFLAIVDQQGGAINNQGVCVRVDGNYEISLNKRLAGSQSGAVCNVQRSYHPKGVDVPSVASLMTCTLGKRSLIGNYNRGGELRVAENDGGRGTIYE